MWGPQPAPGEPPYSNEEEQRKHRVFRALKGLRCTELTPVAFRPCTFARLWIITEGRSHRFHNISAWSTRSTWSCEISREAGPSGSDATGALSDNGHCKEEGSCSNFLPEGNAALRDSLSPHTRSREGSLLGETCTRQCANHSPEVRKNPESTRQHGPSVSSQPYSDGPQRCWSIWSIKKIGKKHFVKDVRVLRKYRGENWQKRLKKRSSIEGVILRTKNPGEEKPNIV